MKGLFIVSAFLMLFSTTAFLKKNVPNLAGTWYVNGRANHLCSITQNGNNLVFSYNNSRSNGYFKSETEVFATEWNTLGSLTVGNAGIIWNNQVWTRQPSSGWMNVAGTWYGDGNANYAYTIEQDNLYLAINFQGQKMTGYFTGANSITVPAWNNTSANITSDGSSITWNNQKWTKQPTTSTPTPTTSTPTTTQQGSTQKLCRVELSSFYFAAQSLGTVWGRAATEPGMLSAGAVADCDAALSVLDGVLGSISCIVFDRNRIRNLRGILSTASSQQVVLETERLIKDLQVVVQNLKVSCDNGVHISALYIAGIHLGAAQAWASSRQCMPTPMPIAIQTTIQNHLTTANNALIPYSACITHFDFSNFTRITANLGSMNSILPHTLITGTETQLLWAIALSDCCCSCSPGNMTDTNTTSACDAECERYCKSLGKQHGRFNGKTACLLGVVSGGSSSGCDCW